jgi:excisionase family DNA binding protein
MSASVTQTADDAVERAYSIEKAAELLSVSKWTIWKWISNRTIISCKIGGRRVIPAIEINRLLRESREENYVVTPRPKKQSDTEAIDNP